MGEGVMLLKGIEEFHQDIILGLFAGFYVGVEFGIVGLPNVVDVEDTTSVLIHNVECFLGEANSERIHLTADTAKEFFVVNAAATIAIEDLEEALGILLRDLNSEVSHGLLEFIKIEISRTIIVSNFELLAKSHNSTCTSGSELCSEVFH
jgi:hypothetical protein